MVHRQALSPLGKAHTGVEFTCVNNILYIIAFSHSICFALSTAAKHIACGYTELNDLCDQII
ncbi:hypothetical protein PN496_17760 [Nodularia spumigena CS-1038]|nr:hypothetical protein [Nodularia spumigena CS-1038]